MSASHHLLLDVTDPPGQHPTDSHRTGALLRPLLALLVALGALASVLVLLVFVVAPSAGAAGGCGGG
jgi:hypothetical protein